jgi:putative PIN family toxin of toxin-antitoxin system
VRRIVLDTNVLVSALLTEAGPSARVLDLCVAGELSLIVDARILREYGDVLRRRQFAFDPDRIAEVLLIADRSERLTAHPLPISLPDPDDQPFLEVAVAGGADAIVTGNERHFRPAKGLDLLITSPAGFLKAL